MTSGMKRSGGMAIPNLLPLSRMKQSLQMPKSYFQLEKVVVEAESRQGVVVWSSTQKCPTTIPADAYPLQLIVLPGEEIQRHLPETLHVEATGLGGRDLLCPIPWDISIRSDKEGQSIYGPSLAPMEETADIPGVFGGTETVQVTALGRTKAAHEFLVLHYFGLDSAKHWDALLFDVLPAFRFPGASARRATALEMFGASHIAPSHRRMPHVLWTDSMNLVWNLLMGGRMGRYTGSPDTSEDFRLEVLLVLAPCIYYGKCQMLFLFMFPEAASSAKRDATPLRLLSWLSFRLEPAVEKLVEATMLYLSTVEEVKDSELLELGRKHLEVDTHFASAEALRDHLIELISVRNLRHRPEALFALFRQFLQRLSLPRICHFLDLVLPPVRAPWADATRTLWTCHYIRAIAYANGQPYEPRVTIAYFFTSHDHIHHVRIPAFRETVDVKSSGRKEAFKLVQSGEKSLSEALADVIKNADLKESYFTTPIALGAQQNFGNKWRRLGDGKGKNDGKGDWKGDRKGKKGKKGDGKQGGGKDHHGNPLASKTPDGREICYAFNSQGCRGRCGRVHVCRVAGCYGDHSAREHAKYANNERNLSGYQNSRDLVLQ
eukprot:symbB.v1.2.032570.t1/scaffold3868.1/size49036/4